MFKFKHFIAESKSQNQTQLISEYGRRVVPFLGGTTDGKTESPGTKPTHHNVCVDEKKHNRI